MSILIRAIARKDRLEWETLWRGYQRFYNADLSKGEEALWQSLLNASGDGPYALVAEDGDGRLTGLAQYLFHKTTWSQAPRCYLNDLFTLEAARGKGVGRALIEAVYRKADEAGVSQIWWLTQEFNHTGRALYDKVAKVTPFIKYIR